MHSESRLEAILHSGTFTVTAEVVPPRGADAEAVRSQAANLVGYADAANVTDNPTSSAHMSSVAGAHLVKQAGLEPVVQFTTRDRNRLAITADLLGAWALGARNVLCLTGDPAATGDHPDAVEVNDLGVLDLIRFVARLRDQGTLLSGKKIESPPRYFVGAADVPLAPGYDPGRLEAKADAGAGFVQTQIVYDLDALGGWAERVRPLGIFERVFVLIGVAPPRTLRSVEFMQEHLPGVEVPDAVVARMREADDPAAEGVAIAVEVIEGLRRIEGIAGVHVMGLGREHSVRQVIERAGLLPRPEEAG